MTLRGTRPGGMPRWEDWKRPAPDSDMEDAAAAGNNDPSQNYDPAAATFKMVDAAAGNYDPGQSYDPSQGAVGTFNMEQDAAQRSAELNYDPSQPDYTISGTYDMAQEAAQPNPEVNYDPSQPGYSATGSFDMRQDAAQRSAELNYDPSQPDYTISTYDMAQEAAQPNPEVKRTTPNRTITPKRNTIRIYNPERGLDGYPYSQKITREWADRRGGSRLQANCDRSRAASRGSLWARHH